MSESAKKRMKLLYRYGVFTLIIAFVISCSMILFVTTLTKEMGIVLSEENVSHAAKLTFVNVIILSVLLTIFDTIRRRISVDAPVAKIIKGANQMTKGDFSVRIPRQENIYIDDKFNEIIDCINKMAEELSSIETLRTDFVANVSHELKTPLAVIQNYGTLLQKPDLSEEEREEYAKVITDCSHKLANLISNILKLNKLENQQIFPTHKSYNLSEQLCECLIAFEDLWEEKNLELEVDIAEDIFVSSDSEMMSLVWNNLFSNAIKFTEPGGKIALRLYPEDEFAIVQVEDSGCGISKEVGKHIFDKFYQGDTSHAVQGNGLGLALVKRVIDITESTIAVESEVGKGTMFTVKMKRIKEEK